MIDSIDSVPDVSRRSRCNREAIDSISVSGDLLELIEVHSDAEIAARHLGRIGATLTITLSASEAEAPAREERATVSPTLRCARSAKASSIAIVRS
jgi:hypothetical protein